MIILDKNNLFCSVMTKTEKDPLLESEMTFPGLRLCYIVQGDAGWRINGVQHRVKTGDIIALDETQRRLFTDYGEAELKVFIMQFDRKTFSDRRYFIIFSELIKATDCVIRNETLSTITDEIYNESMADGDGKYDLLSAKTTEFFIKAQRIFSLTDKITEEDGKLADILDIIDLNRGVGISLSEAARISGFSESTFSRKFLKHFGIPFKRYVMMKKVERAVLLLKTTDMKVVDVAYESGFNSISGFYDTFKKITGTTPDKILSVI